MESNTSYITLPIGEAARIISSTVVRESRSGTMADCHELRADGRLRGIVMVFEKYYLRSSSRLSMTVTLDDLEGATRVHWTVTGGSGVFGNNGESKVAAEKFSAVVRELLFSSLA